VGGVALDFEDATDLRPMHLAFFVNEVEFDGPSSGCAVPGSPPTPTRSRQPGETNHQYGGRGVYSTILIVITSN
jgi:hypothetical protein